MLPGKKSLLNIGKNTVTFFEGKVVDEVNFAYCNAKVGSIHCSCLLCHHLAFVTSALILLWKRTHVHRAQD